MLVVSEAEVGKGYNADDLHRRQLEQLKVQLSNVHPTLHVRGVEILCAKIRAEDALRDLQAEVAGTLGGEATREALALFAKDAEAIVAGERAKARVSGNARMAGNAADLPQGSRPKPAKAS